MSATTPPPLPPREPDSHKGDYGRLLLIGGSVGMPGAISLAGMAALRGGAGLVTIATSASAAPIVASFHPCYMTMSLNEDSGGLLAAGADEQLQSALQAADVVTLGPGMGRSAALDRMVAKWYQSIEKPLVIDADALNALSDGKLEARQHDAPRVLTPHPGEFQRLADRAFTARAEMERAAIAFAREHQLIVVLKGHRTLITDGVRSEHNSTGNPGMATGGAGDVLSGLLSALIGQHENAFEAVRLGVHIHGLAGDLAAQRLGQISLTASDICEALPAAFCHS